MGRGRSQCGSGGGASIQYSVIQVVGGLLWAAFPVFMACMSLPYRVATLLYCFNEQDEVLLLQRAKEPNRELWSPSGGKLDTGGGESPYRCACREAREELGLAIQPSELHLTGIVSEHGYEGEAHWLMFLFEVKPRLKSLPPPHREGIFKFFARAELGQVKIPQTDRERIWPMFWEHRGGFFAAHCDCKADGTNVWTIEETVFGGDSSSKNSIPGPMATSQKMAVEDA